MISSGPALGVGPAPGLHLASGWKATEKHRRRGLLGRCHEWEGRQRVFSWFGFLKPGLLPPLAQLGSTTRGLCQGGMWSTWSCRRCRVISKENRQLHSRQSVALRGSAEPEPEGHINTAVPPRPPSPQAWAWWRLQDNPAWPSPCLHVRGQGAGIPRIQQIARVSYHSHVGGGSHLAAGKTKTGNVGDLWSLRWSEMEEGREMSLAWWMSNSACTPGFQLSLSSRVAPRGHSTTASPQSLPKFRLLPRNHGCHWA